MYWVKPKNLKYVDMCRWIDENAHKPDCDQIQLYNYLYSIIFILAYKWRYFENARDYDDFSLTTASFVFNRLVSKDNSKIKNVLDYLKKTLHYRKITWVRMYSQEQRPLSTDIDTNIVDYRVRDLISGGINKCNFQIYLEDISSAIYGTIKNIPRDKNSYEFNNIYISCLLTFLNQISLTLDAEESLNSLSSSVAYDSAYSRVYRIEKDRPPILYHLDQSYSGYIALLVRKARMSIRDELTELLYENIPSIGIGELLEDKDDNGQFEES